MTRVWKPSERSNTAALVAKRKSGPWRDSKRKCSTASSGFFGDEYVGVVFEFAKTLADFLDAMPVRLGSGGPFRSELQDCVRRLKFFRRERSSFTLRPGG